MSLCATATILPLPLPSKLMLDFTLLPPPSFTSPLFFLLCQGAALGTMVGLLTFGNRKFESLDSVMRQAITPLHEATQKLLPLADQDSQAFSDYLVRREVRDRGSRGIRVLKLFHILFLPLIGCTETASENRRAKGKVLVSLSAGSSGHN